MLLFFALSAVSTAVLLAVLYGTAALATFFDLGLLETLVKWIYRNVGVPFAVSAVGILSFVAIFLLLSRSMIRDMAAITQAVQQIADGNLQARIRLDTEDELGVLAANINRMAERLHQSIEEERRSERAKAELITNVSHDLRTPLTSITGYLGLIEQDRYRDEPELRQYVSIAYDKSQRMRRLIDDLFEYTRTSGGMKLHAAPIDLGELLGQLAAHMRLDAEAAGMELRLSIPPSRVMVMADGDKLVRIFENLLTNALTYGRAGRYADLALRAENGSAVASVTNYGDPIPYGDLPHLFERFYRVDKSRGEQAGGSGLGLAIARNITLLHGGSIHAASDEAQTRFEVRLPLIPGDIR